MLLVMGHMTDRLLLVRNVYILGFQLYRFHLQHPWTSWQDPRTSRLYSSFLSILCLLQSRITSESQKSASYLIWRYIDNGHSNLQFIKGRKYDCFIFFPQPIKPFQNQSFHYLGHPNNLHILLLFKIFCQTYISNVLHTYRTVQLRDMNEWATGQRNARKTEWGELALKPWSSVCIGRFFFLKAFQRQRVKEKVAGQCLEAHWPTCEGFFFNNRIAY